VRDRRLNPISSEGDWETKRAKRTKRAKTSTHFALFALFAFFASTLPFARKPDFKNVSRHELQTKMMLGCIPNTNIARAGGI
jgi:hypothetical protein